MKEYTYLMTDGLYYKIGKSSDPEKRLKTIITGNPNCSLVFYGDGRTEKQLHDIFRLFKVRGEWYRLRKKQVDLIGRLLFNTATGEDLVMCARLRSAQLREKEYQSFVFTFGKYKGRSITDMVSDEEIRYLEWVQTWPKIDKSNPKLLRAVNNHFKELAK